MLNINKSPIWYYQQPVDFRKQINGLVLFLAGEIGVNPGSGDIFIFRSKKTDKLKILVWDRNGFWLIYRKLEKGRFRFPKKEEKLLELSNEQMQWLISGLNIEKLQLQPKLKAEKFH